MKKIAALVLLITILFLSLSHTSLGAYQSKSGVVPADTKFSVELLSPISTQSNKKGDEFTCKVLAPSEFADALITGIVVRIKAAGKTTKKSEITLAFDRITLPDGRSGVFSGVVLEVYDIVAVDKGQVEDRNLADKA